MRAEIDALGGDAAPSHQFEAALRDRRSELQRTRDYADSIGCGSGFFDDSPPQCDDVSARIERMQEELEQLQQQQQSAQLDDTGRRRALTRQYDEACGSPPAGGPPEPGESPRADPLDALVTPPDDAAPADDLPGRQVQTRALCVRHCDGGFFPITDQAAPDKLEGLDQLCKALCPNAEASLYTTAPGGGIETAIASDGASYTALPAAFKYQKSYDPSCSCKPPHQSWVEALAGAEELLDRDKGDVTVTQQMSDSMSRPAVPAQPRSSTRPAKKPLKNKSQSADQIATPALPDDTELRAGENPGEDIMRQIR